MLTYSGTANPIQGFRTDRLVSGATFTPGQNGTAFRVGVDTGYYLGTASTVVMPLPAGSVTVINSSLTYTFSSSIIIEIMD